MLGCESDREAFKEYFFMLIKNQPEPTLYFGKNLAKDDSFIDVQVNWTYKRDAQGSLAGFISIITDGGRPDPWPPCIQQETIPVSDRQI